MQTETFGGTPLFIAQKSGGATPEEDVPELSKINKAPSESVGESYNELSTTQ